MIVGYVLAVVAALASGSGGILESMGIQRAGAYGGRSLDLINLRRQWLYFLGLGVDMVGFASATVALHRLPLFLVQSVLAFSIGVTATIAALMGTRLAAAGWAALGIDVVGLCLLAVAAEPGPARALPAGWDWALPGMAVVVAAIAWYVRRRNDALAGPLLAFDTGLGFAAVSVSARTLNIPDPLWQVVLEPSVWAIVVNGLVAAVVFAMALQKGGATSVTAIMFSTNTAVSSLVGLLYLDDRVRPGFGGLAVAGFVLAIAGAIGTAHYASIARGRNRRPAAATARR